MTSGSLIALLGVPLARIQLVSELVLDRQCALQDPCSGPQLCVLGTYQFLEGLLGGDVSLRLVRELKEPLVEEGGQGWDAWHGESGCPVGELSLTVVEARLATWTGYDGFLNLSSWEREEVLPQPPTWEFTLWPRIVVYHLLDQLHRTELPCPTPLPNPGKS